MGDQIKCISQHGEIQVTVDFDEGMRKELFRFHMVMACAFKVENLLDHN